MKPEEAREIIAQGEGQRTEFKKSFAEDNDAIEALCAFANADGGTVFFGVTDDKTIIGVQLGRITLEQFANKIKRETSPSITPPIYKISLGDRLVVAVTVQKALQGQLFFAFNRVFIRVGNTNQPMSAEEQRARLQSGERLPPEERDHDSEKIVARTPPRLQFQVLGTRQAVPSGKYIQVVFVIRNIGKQAARDFAILILIDNAVPLDSHAPWAKIPQKYAEFETAMRRYAELMRSEGSENAWQDYRLVPDPDPPCYGTIFALEGIIEDVPDRTVSLAGLPALRADFYDHALLPSDCKVLRFFVAVDREQDTLHIHSAILSKWHGPLWQDYDVQVEHFVEWLY